MAAVTRQPFAPLDGARLQSLTSLKNRQNALSIASPVKRKASDIVDVDDSENVDPVLFSKRSKGVDGLGKDLFKPSSILLTKAISTPSLPSKDVFSAITSPVRAASPRPRAMLNPKSPAAKLNTTLAKSSPLSAPAGRSPTRGSKRIGILSNRRRTASPFTRVDPPAFNLSPAPFSLDAALKGTIPSYAAKPTPTVSASSSSLSSLHDAELKSSWFFDIHEDTPEQEMTNLLQHSTCTLDISSDEESELRATRERAEGRDKENIPPADDVSQTSARRRARVADLGDMDFEKQRDPLGDLSVEEFYAEGCDSTSVVIIPADDEDGTVVEGEADAAPPASSLDGAAPAAFEFAPELKLETAELETPQEPDSNSASATAQLDADVDALMGRQDASKQAALLEPMEGTGESFDLWESGSAKDEADGAPTPVPASPCSDTTEILGEEC